jgi:hypothetical protein
LRRSSRLIGRVAAELARDHPGRPAQTMQVGDADAFISDKNLADTVGGGAVIGR